MEYNATVKIVYRDQIKMVFRVYPDSVKLKYLPGQYGALGVKSDFARVDGLVALADSPTPIKRAYSVSSSILNENLLHYTLQFPSIESKLNIPVL